jgi:hypothetical protein
MRVSSTSSKWKMVVGDAGIDPDRGKRSFGKENSGLHMFLLIGPAAQGCGGRQKNAIASSISRYFQGSIPPRF